MPNIRKGFTNPEADSYILPTAADLRISEPPPPPVPVGEIAPSEREEPAAPAKTPVDYAKIQAEAILAAARLEAAEMTERATQAAAEELEELRRIARDEGYRQGYAEGVAGGMSEAKRQREEQAVEQEAAVGKFLEAAAQAREEMLEELREELKDVAIAIAEKIIRISLKSSSDIIVRMIQTATEKHRRREWVHIYIAGCDAKALAQTTPELTAMLGHLSDRVRIIPMAEDESGTCIIEMPDEILDASISTQLANIKTMLSGGVRQEMGDGYQI